jgi:hypothetical protein
MASSKYFPMLKLRGKWWSYRKRVPQYLRGLFQGRREIVVSMHTQDEGEARVRVLAIAHETEKALQRAREKHWTLVVDKPSYGPPTQPRGVEIAFKEDEGDSTAFRVSPDLSQVWPVEPYVDRGEPRAALEDAASDLGGRQVAHRRPCGVNGWRLPTFPCPRCRREAAILRLLLAGGAHSLEHNEFHPFVPLFWMLGHVLLHDGKYLLARHLPLLDT